MEIKWGILIRAPSISASKVILSFISVAFFIIRLSHYTFMSKSSNFTTKYWLINVYIIVKYYCNIKNFRFQYNATTSSFLFY